MKLHSLLSAAAITSLMSLSFIASAQNRDRDNNLKRKGSTTQSSRHRDDDRLENDRRDNDRRSDDRRGSDRRDDDRWENNRRGNDRRDNDRWDRNNGHGNGRHNGSHRDSGRTTVNVSYNTRHDDWHRGRRSSHNDHCTYDSGNWRYNDTRYYRNDNYRNHDYRYDDHRYDPGYEYHRREETSREWRSLATLGGILSVIGMLNNDDTLVFAGAAGALYSDYRYQQDRRSQDRIARGRAYYFDQPYFYRDGRKYERRTVNRNGQRYFQFVRCD